MSIGKPVAALVGFGFVAMWIATNLGYAVLCLVGAAIFYVIAGVVQGEIDVSEWQERLGSGPSGLSAPTLPPRRRSRVQ